MLQTQGSAQALTNHRHSREITPASLQGHRRLLDAAPAGPSAAELAANTAVELAAAEPGTASASSGPAVAQQTDRAAGQAAAFGKPRSAGSLPVAAQAAMPGDGASRTAAAAPVQTAPAQPPSVLAAAGATSFASMARPATLRRPSPPSGDASRTALGGDGGGAGAASPQPGFAGIGASDAGTFPSQYLARPVLSG